MLSAKIEIIQRLKREILPLESFKPVKACSKPLLDFPPIERSFPQQVFPEGVVHEFLSASPEDAAATTGFISIILGKLMQEGGVSLWINPGLNVFPPALKAFGLEPSMIVFVDIKKEKERLWVMEEALKCDRLSAVVGEVQHISLTESRKLQLACEKSRVTGMVLRPVFAKLNTIAAVSRWRVSHHVSDPGDDLPGVGFPCWNVALEKVRNGKPGSWLLQWHEQRLNLLKQEEIVFTQPLKKVG